jgi:uncharacterized membrane protein YadS
LWDKYNDICGLVLVGGTLQKTADGMNPKAASACGRQVAKEMTNLAVAVELARTLRLIPLPIVASLPVEDALRVEAHCRDG